VNRRMFVCGDIHGCVDALMAKLNSLDFDFAKDHLYSLGDLVDRGSQNVEAVRLLNEPWFSAIKGNHELIMECANESGNTEAQGMHLINGGIWFSLLDQTERDELVAMVEGLPVAMTVITPSGRKVGLVHADMPGNDWDHFMSRLDEQSVQDYALWSRERVGHAQYGRGVKPITGVDHVYFGHTPMREPLRAANMSWIDTGCFATGVITVEELL
jgi:serine/threonine protein phosphatase 1